MGSTRVFHEAEGAGRKHSQELIWGPFPGPGQARPGREGRLWLGQCDSATWALESGGLPQLSGPGVSGAGGTVAQSGSESGPWVRLELLNRCP